MATVSHVREAVVQALYANELGNPKVLEQFEEHLRERRIKGKKRELAKSYLRGVLGALSELDRLLEKNLIGWELKSLDKVDKQILRLALYEIFKEGNPYPVVISEAVKLANLYSEAKSGKFINGVLHRIGVAEGIIPAKVVEIPGKREKELEKGSQLKERANGGEGELKKEGQLEGESGNRLEREKGREEEGESPSQLGT
ncbi:MAG: transcription antitermination factor NusB [Campylobacterales bacterium]